MTLNAGRGVPLTTGQLTGRTQNLLDYWPIGYWPGLLVTAYLPGSSCHQPPVATSYYLPVASGATVTENLETSRANNLPRNIHAGFFLFLVGHVWRHNVQPHRHVQKTQLVHVLKWPFQHVGVFVRNPENHQVFCKALQLLPSCSVWITRPFTAARVAVIWNVEAVANESRVLASFDAAHWLGSWRFLLFFACLHTC